jgi:hypothetical protein
MNIELDNDSMERLRESLLADEEVRVIISMRAYEIYVNRGAAPGREADDWFQAENEIIPILINEELNKRNEGYIPRRPKTVKPRKKAKDPAMEAAPTIATSQLEPSAPLEVTNGHGKKSGKAKSAEPKKKAISKAKSPAEIDSSTLVATSAVPAAKAVEKDAKAVKGTKDKEKVAKGADKEAKASAKEVKTAAKLTKPPKAKTAAAGLSPKAKKSAN